MERCAITQSSLMPSSAKNPLKPINSFHVEMTIIQGRGLAAKDRHFLTRQRTTSDPYVVASLGLDQRLGRTKTRLKTLDPVWESKFEFSVPNKRHVQVPMDMSKFIQHNNKNGTVGDRTGGSTNHMIEACSMVLLKIYDHDDFTDDDMMGTLVVPIPVAPRSGLSTTCWYNVDTLFVPNAVGQVQVSLKITPEFGSMPLRKLIPSPETFAHWAGRAVGKNETVDDNNVVVENEASDRKNYVMAVFRQFT